MLRLRAERGSCQSKAAKLKVAVLENASMTLAASVEQVELHAKHVTERELLLTRVKAGEPLAGGGTLEPTRVDELLASLAPTKQLLTKQKTALVATLAATQAALDVQQQAAAKADCVPKTVHAGSGKVTECQCVTPQEPCRPTADRKGCEQTCPAKTIAPDAECKVRVNPARIGQPGVDAEGRFCHGECSGRVSTCGPCTTRRS